MPTYTFWTLDWDELVIKGYADDNQYIIIEANTMDGILVWSKKIDATKGNSDLISRTWIHTKPTRENPVLVVGTDGEHHRGASKHEEAFVKFTKRGELVDGELF